MNWIYFAIGIGSVLTAYGIEFGIEWYASYKNI